MKMLTTKNSFELNDDGSKYILPVGSKVNFVKETYHFYHAYYESHNYKALVEYKNKNIELRVHRVHGTKSFNLLNCNPTHNDNKDVRWNSLFEEECPLEIR